MKTLAGRVAIITGAERDIGAAVAIRLAAEGAAVAVNYRDDQTRDGAESVTARISADGGVARPVVGDVSRPEQVQAMIDEVTAVRGPPAILINNAAVSVAARVPWHEWTAAAWDEVLRVNVTGAFLCSRAVYPAMRKLGRGDIVNMSSITPFIGRTGNLHYVTSKAALVGFTHALAREIGPEHIRVNALVLDAIQSSVERVYGAREEVDAQVLGEQSLRQRGVPEDVAGAVAFLVGPDAGFITGQCLTVDGGWLMS